MLLNLEQHKITGVQHFLLVLQVCASGWAVGQLPLFTLQIFFSAKKLISGPIKNFFIGPRYTWGPIYVSRVSVTD